MNLDSIGVYRISSPNGSVYIGMTAKSFRDRWNTHKANFRKGQMTCAGLRRAFEKYGLDAMSFEVLEEMDGCSDAEILHREREWWLLHKAQGANLYNGEPSGTGSVRHTEESRFKTSSSFESSWRKRNGISDEIAVHRVLKTRGDGEIRTTFNIEIECAACGDLFIGSPKRKFCSKPCARNAQDYSNRASKTAKISKDSLISEIQLGGNSYAVADRLGIKKSSLYGLLQKYNLTFKEVQRSNNRRV